MTRPRFQSSSGAGDLPAPRHVGYVGLAGVPNVGKSTLVNRLVGQKISIVTERPQTTRERVCGIYTDDNAQLILVDIPGIIEPRDRLGNVLLDWVEYGLRGCDVIMHLRDARRAKAEDDPKVIEMIHASGRPVWLVWNKIDKGHQELPTNPSGTLRYARTYEVSGLTGQGLPELLEALTQAMPIGSLLFDPDQTCDRDLRFLVAELVREQLFRHLDQEIPYGTVAVTETFEERPDGLTYLKVQILTEREAHKPIILGQGGKMIRTIGSQARTEIESLLETRVFLDLQVKVRPKWRSDDRQLGNLGLKPRKGRNSS